MTALDTKLRRDLWAARGQVVTIALVLGAAISGLVSMVGTYRALTAARERYYERTGFPDVFAHLGRAPDAVADRLRALPGVTSVEPRLVEPGVARTDDMDELASARVIALPGGARPTLDGLVLRSGRVVEPDRPEEAVVLEAFAAAHGLVAGDPLRVTFGGRQHRLRIVGTVLSPEYIFSIAEGAIMPDEKRLAVVYMGRDAIAAGLGAKGTFDDVTLRLAGDASPAEAVDAVDRALARHGGRGAVARADHPSTFFVTNEVEQLSVLATRIPALFLFVGVFLINVVLSRLVSTQREQIAALRAVGYGKGAIARHYLAFVAVVAVLGGVIGAGLGDLIGRRYCDLYRQFFHFPDLAWHLDLDLVGDGVALSGLAAALGAIRAMRAAANLPPAEAMRPPSPARYRKGLLSRLGALRVVPPTARLVVRELERRPVRAALSVLGLATAVAILVVGNFQSDTIRWLEDVQFEQAITADVTIGLVDPAPMSVVSSVRALPGVLDVEPTLAVPVRIRVGPRHRDVAISGSVPGAHLRAVLDLHGRPIAVPPRGLMIAVAMAERLGVRVGDVVEVERLDDHRVRRVEVTALSDEMIGRSAYMQLDALAALWGEEPRASALLAAVDPLRMGELERAIARLPGIAAAAETRTVRAAFEGTTASSAMTLTLIVLAIGTVIAIGVVYNNGRITLSERERELATLRVLGFTRDEVASAVVAEMVMHLVVALPVGLWLGRVLAEALMTTVDPEQYRMLTVIGPGTYALAALVVVAAAAGTALLVSRRVAALDPVSALKARD